MTDLPPNLEPSSLNVVGKSIDERIFSANFVFATLANLLYAISGQMMNTTLPVYVMSLNGSKAQAGLVSGMVSITALLFRPLIGWVTDVWRRRPIVLLGLSSYTVASVIYAFSGSIGAILFGRVTHGFGLSCYSTASNSYVADIAPPKRRTEAIGIFTATKSIGQILGPALGFYIISLLDFHWLFKVATGLALVTIFASLFAKEKPIQKKIQRSAWSWRTDIVAIDALPISWTAFCLGMSTGSVTAFIAIFASSRGIENPGLYFSVQAVALLLSRVFSGRVADKYGHIFAIIPGAIAMSIALASLPLVHALPLMLISAALMGLGSGMVQPATMALLVEQVRSDQRGLAIATYFVGFDGGVFLGSVAFGFVSEAWGFGIMWPLVAVCALLGIFGVLRPPRAEVPISG